MMKKLIALAAIIAVFIPTYISVAYYISAQNAPVAERTVMQLTLTDLDGNEYVFDKDTKESKEMISFFIDMNDSAKEVEDLPEQLENNDPFKAVYKSYNRDREYKYYFTKDPGEAYYVDDQKNVFSIKEKTAIEFLNMKYAESIFEAAAQPKLIVSADKELAPYTIDWQYRAAGNKFIPTAYKGNKDSTTEFSVAGNLLLEFDNKPDYINVKIMNGSEVVFNDIYDNLTSDIIGETIRKYNVEVEAKWYENNERDYCGEAKYMFVANVVAPPSFFLGENTVEHGDFVVITGKNIIDVDKVGFTSEPAINYTPVFYREGDFAIALVPISIDLEFSPTYKFTLTSNGVSEELSLTVTNRKIDTLYPNPPLTGEMIAKRTDAVMSSFNNSIKEVIATNESTRYWSSVFAQPLGRGVHWGFGKYVVLSSTAGKFLNKGVDYIVPTGFDVNAVNRGKVVYIGEHVYSGNFVVIDHGYGLKSWYMNMDQITVKVGDIVETNAPIGTTGRTGFSDFSGGGNLHYEVTINGVQVCPYSLSEEGVKIMYPGT